MKVSEWLRHLNFERYTKKFMEINIRTVNELRHVKFGKLATFGITAHLDKQRIMDVIRSDNAEIVSLFGYQTRAEARTIVS
jgi:hypothetical protein